MRKFYTYKSKIIFIFCLVFALLSVTGIKAQESKIENLIKEVSADSQKDAISNYSYLMKFTCQHHKFGGSKLTRLYEAILPSRIPPNNRFQHPFVLLEDSERTVTSEEILESRRSIAREIEKFENENETKTIPVNDKFKEDGGYWTIHYGEDLQDVKVDVLQLLKNSILSNLQTRQFGKTKSVTIDFSPNSNVVFEKSLGYLSKIEGRIWIDEKTKRIIRVEGFALGVFNKESEKPDAERQKEAAFYFEQAMVPEGFWFPRVVKLNFTKLTKDFKPIEIAFTFMQYKKWGVNIQYN